MCLRKKQKPVQVSPMRPTPKKEKSPEQHRREVSEELQEAIHKYRIYNPNVMVISSPYFEYEKREVQVF